MSDAGSTAAARSKSQQAYHVIKERIVRHEYSPGYRLVLGRIANELDMSVVPVREAIRRLEAETLVTYEPNVGAHVSMVDDTQYRYSMQTLGILEGAATALAAPLMTPDDLRIARQVNEQMTRSLEHFDPHTFTAQNQQFHAMLYTRCPNPRLLDLVKAEWGRLGNLRDSTFSFVPKRAYGSVREHEHILRLIEDQAPLEDIEAAAREHRAATLAAYLDLKRPDEAAGGARHPFRAALAN
ncbi:MAG: GntR family transcriptional regulator [Mycobacteriales bacterium]